MPPNQTVEGLAQLDDLLPHLAADAPIGVVEQHEETLKRILGAAFERGVTDDDGRRIAAFQRDVGLIMKYKPYAIKASTPLGYSIFLQEPAQGFSFQKHSVRKVEAFHILEANDQSFVFLCSWAEWQRVYEPERFQRWLEGAPDDAYERFRIRPTVGDVFLITDRDTVHTVIGCQIEEYASVSVDVVHRLHDQNRSAPMPAKFTRAFALERLETLAEPRSHRDIDVRGHATPITSTPAGPGVERVALVRCPELQATIWRLAPGARTESLAVGVERAVQIYVSRGTASISIGDASDTAPVIVKRTGTTLVAPGLTFSISNDTSEPVAVSMHDVAWRPAIRTLDA